MGDFVCGIFIREKYIENSFQFNSKCLPEGQKYQVTVGIEPGLSAGESNGHTIRPKKKLLCFFFFFFLCQIWAKNLLRFVFNGLKKHLYMRFDCIPPEFSPFRNFKKNIGKPHSLTVRKKKKKKKIDRPTQFSNFGRVRAT